MDEESNYIPVYTTMSSSGASNNNQLNNVQQAQQLMYYQQQQQQQLVHHHHQEQPRDALKRKLTLDLIAANNHGGQFLETPNTSGPGTGTANTPTSVIKRTRYSNNRGLNSGNSLEVLSSPDLQAFKLGSPEIERLILSQTNGLATPTPISSYFMAHNGGVGEELKGVSTEQEIYVKGFQEALNRLHAQNDAAAAAGHNNVATDNNVGMQAPTPTMVTRGAGGAKRGAKATRGGGANTKGRGGGRKPTRQISASSSISSSIIEDSDGSEQMLDIKPNKASLMLNMNPIDLDNQEKIKLERKRLRNRVAASKCRKRKLERIAKLEVKVDQLRSENVELSSVATKLRDNIGKLKVEIDAHVARGCHFDQNLINSLLA